MCTAWRPPGLRRPPTVTIPPRGSTTRSSAPPAPSSLDPMTFPSLPKLRSSFVDSAKAGTATGDAPTTSTARMIPVRPGNRFPRHQRAATCLPAPVAGSGTAQTHPIYPTARAAGGAAQPPDDQQRARGSDPSKSLGMKVPGGVGPGWPPWPGRRRGTERRSRSVSWRRFSNVASPGPPRGVRDLHIGGFRTPTAPDQPGPVPPTSATAP